LKAETDADAEQCASDTEETDEGTRACPLRMTICNEPEIAKDIRTLLTKGIVGQRGKHKALGMKFRFICPDFFLVSASAREFSFN
jgi:hypothetical protein